MNLSVRPGLSCLHGRGAENGVRGRKQHASELLGGGPGPFSPFCVCCEARWPWRAAPRAGVRECGRAGEALTPPHRLLAIGMMHGCCRGFVGWVRCVCAHGLLAGGRTGVGLEQGRELDREQEQIDAGGLIGQLCQFGETGRDGGLIIIGIHAQQIIAEERWKASCRQISSSSLLVSKNNARTCWRTLFRVPILA